MAQVVIVEDRTPVMRLPRNEQISAAEAKRLAKSIKDQGFYPADSGTVELTPRMKVEVIE